MLLVLANPAYRQHVRRVMSRHHAFWVIDAAARPGAARLIEHLRSGANHAK
jgi:hypothetical protein